MERRYVNLTKIKLKTIVCLLLTAVVVLLCNTEVFILSNKWYKRVNVCLTKADFDLKTLPPPPEATATSTSPTTQSKPEKQRCSFSFLSAENAKEGRRLLDSITWPETSPLSKPFSLNLTTSAAKSSFTIVPRSGGWSVGDELTVKIQIRDFNGHPKMSGGDFLTSKLYSQKLGAGVVGQVQDHLDGTFTTVFPLLWSGTADIEVMLVQTSESITVLKRLTKEHPDRIYFFSEFRSGSVTEVSYCNVCMDPDKHTLCNLTDLNTGEQWFCIKPKTLDCSTRVSHGKGGFIQKISMEEATLFQSDINMKAPITAEGNSSVTVFPKAGETKKTRPEPAGYYYGNQWRPLRGPSIRSFNSTTAVTACLSGKQLHLLGDSTIRQYYEYITGRLPNLLTFDKHSPHQSGPLLAVDHKNDIMVTYRGHGPPIRFPFPAISQLRYVANEVDGLTGGPNTVVVIGVWSHFSTFPMEVYYQRLMTIHRALRRLLNRAPKTKVIIRTANMKALSLYESLTNSGYVYMGKNSSIRSEIGLKF